MENNKNNIRNHPATIEQADKEHIGTTKTKPDKTETIQSSACATQRPEDDLNIQKTRERIAQLELRSPRSDEKNPNSKESPNTKDTKQSQLVHL